MPQQEDTWDIDREGDFGEVPVYAEELLIPGAMYQKNNRFFLDWNPVSPLQDTAEPRLVAWDILLYLGLGRFLHLRENILIYICKVSYNRGDLKEAFDLVSTPE